MITSIIVARYKFEEFAEKLKAESAEFTPLLFITGKTNRAFGYDGKTYVSVIKELLKSYTDVNEIILVGFKPTSTNQKQLNTLSKRHNLTITEVTP